MRTWKRTVEKNYRGETKTTYTSNDGYVIKSETSHSVYGTKTTVFAVYKDDERKHSFPTLKFAKEAIENGWV